MDYQTTPTRNQAMAKAYQAPMFKQQGEEIKNMYRNLKIQFNITQDENVRLRTRAQQMHLDLCRKEKDIENLTRQLQQQAAFLQNGGSLPSKSNYVESFLVL